MEFAPGRAGLGTGAGVVGPEQVGRVRPMETPAVARGPRHRRPSRLSSLLPPDVSSRVLAGTAVVLIGCVLAFGAVTAVRNPRWSPIDEAAHFSYIQQIAQHGSLPVLGHAFVSEPVLAIGQGRYPGAATVSARHDGLAGLSYEAFQPPLYYALAVPVFDLSGNYQTKAVLLRFFDLVLLVVAIALFGRLCRLVLKDRWLFGLATGMLAFALPGVVVVSVLISNMSLETPLVIACVSELWLAWERSSPARVISASVLAGLAVLTDLFGLALVPALMVVAGVVLWRRHAGRDVVAVGAGATLAGLIVAPWLVFNELTYHALTASALAKHEQAPVVNPHHLYYSVALVGRLTVEKLFGPAVPQGWTLTGPGIVAWVPGVLGAVVVGAPLLAGALLAGTSSGRRLAGTGYWVLAVPWLTSVALCWGISLGGQWLTMHSRYTYPTLPVLTLVLAATVVLVVRELRLYVAGVVVAGALVVVTWVVLFPQIATR
ncbi:MAG: ArnT family glycosyltransferase [Acidimicrobiales bacterium]